MNQPPAQPASATNSNAPAAPAKPASQPRSGADRSGMLATALTASLCTLLGVNLLVMTFGQFGPQAARAQVSGYTNGGLINALPPTGVIPAPENIPSAPVSAVEMLKRVIEQQMETNARLSRIEGQLAGPQQVNVINWPANAPGAAPPAPPAVAPAGAPVK
ncbi:MAG TPA: hypothetical protein VEB22_08610 [Phycisphaerales bacterium]|nr:hypothetical protein [Phycisphaerales bacterium]